jgi:APA family basic amino acid/polyamine antiporter
VLPYAFCAIAEIILILNKREFPGKRIAKLCVIPALAFAYSLYVIYGAGSLQIAIGFFLSVLGLPVYIIVHKRLMKAREETARDAVEESTPATEAPAPTPGD